MLLSCRSPGGRFLLSHRQLQVQICWGHGHVFSSRPSDLDIAHKLCYRSGLTGPKDCSKSSEVAVCL